MFKQFEVLNSSPYFSPSGGFISQPVLESRKSLGVMPELVDLTTMSLKHASSMSLKHASSSLSVTPEPGSTPATAYNLGALTATPTKVTEAVNSSDIDYYKFTLSAASNFNLCLTDLSADVDVQLLASDGTTQLNISPGYGSVDEAINHTLSGGTYYLKVYPWSGANTGYTLRVSATPPPLTTSPSNLLSVETDVGTLSGTRTFSNRVDNTDTADVFRFSLNADSKFNLTLTGLSADADVRLIRDTNNNRIVEPNVVLPPYPNGEVLQVSRLGGSSDESINLETLAAGTYFVQVYQHSGNTNYTLNLSTSLPSSYLPSDLLAVETDVGTLSGTRIFSDRVDSQDTADVFRFSLGANSNFNLTLTGLSGDADVRLIRDTNNNGIVEPNVMLPPYPNGEVIQVSRLGGNASEWISTALKAGTYFVQVYQHSGNTDYNLSLSTGDWYSQNLSDPGIIGLARKFAADGQLSRNDMMAILRDTEDGNTIDSTELTDLRTFVSGRRSIMPDYVYNLSNKVVNPYDPNIRSGIGNLVGNDPATRMENLIGKHFLGTYRPTADSGTTYQYVYGSLFQNGISYGDIAQSSILGDCYYLAALAGTAFRAPSTIQSMFTDNGDGTYTVRFYNNGVADYVTVDRYLPTYSDGTAVYASWNGGSRFESNNELWVALAEKAYAQMNEAGWTGHGTTNSYAAIEGGWPDDAVEQITARNTVRDLTLTDSDRTAVINAFNAGRIVFLNWATHALTLVGYNSTTQRFTIYNPWGHSDEFTWSEILNGKPGEQRFTDWSNTTT